MKNIQVEKQNLLTSNKSLADYNLSLEPRLVQERSQLAETYEKGVTLEDEYKSLKLRLGKLLWITAGFIITTNTELILYSREKCLCIYYNYQYEY